MTLVSYTRLGGTYPPDRETLDVADDGRISIWRSVCDGAVGQFERDSQRLDHLARLVDAARRARAPEGLMIESGEPVEKVVIGDDVEASFGASSTVTDDPWGRLLDAARSELIDTSKRPVAAVGATLSEPGVLRLAHHGTEVLPLELASLTVEVSRIHEELQAGWAIITRPDLGRVEAGVGWSLDVALDDDAANGPGMLVVDASFVVDDHGVFVPVGVSARSEQRADLPSSGG